MCSSLAHPYKPSTLSRVALIAALSLLLSGWTCSALFLSCQGVAQSQVTSLSPDAIPSNAESVLLTADGSGFTPQSQIMWNGNALQTRFMDSHHLHGHLSSSGTCARRVRRLRNRCLELALVMGF